MTQAAASPDAGRVDTLPSSLKASWGAGALGVAVLMNGIGTLALFYMSSVLGLDAALAGTIIFASKLFDVVTDPLVGAWSDRTRSPHGRRRPFLFSGAVVSALSFLMLFAVPDLQSSFAVACWVLVALMSYTLGYSLFNVPYVAMPAEMTDSYHERSSIHAWRMVFVAVGGFIASSAFPVFLEVMGRAERSTYFYTGIMGAAIIFTAMMVAYLGTGKARFTARGPARASFRDDLGAMFSNTFFLRLLGVKLAQLLGVAATQATMMFWIIYGLKLPLTFLGGYGAVMTVSTIVSAGLLVRISKKVGKREGYMIAGVCYTLYALSWMFAGPGEPAALLFLRGIIVGVAAAGNVIFAMSMLTDIIEFDARTTGIRREGAYTAFYSLVEKMTAAAGPLIIGLALSAVDFNPAHPELAGDNLRQALLLGVCYLPAACGAAALAILSTYRLTESELAKAAAHQMGDQQ